ncbi:LOW QUALITY PROTEIN: exopolygalacturonase [Jatropha curcas]|uniref:LOW QUALITY PROTEIN: exopolygalacturonase n=1 Tax=Jatropha curcas TaxID=180498 RepID=UPI001895837D|nr:LOW QUALITY PROTEIN: exopolygalacturonase [Jatropha curcas]
MSLLLLFLSTVEAQAVFDITKYGAQADEKTDCCEAVMSAWKEACAAGSSKVLIPKGTFLMGIVKLEGPCKGAMEIELQGTLKAPADPKAIKGEGWITHRIIDHVDQLTICGGGTFDGQGEAAWKANDCKNGGEAPPMSLMLNCITNSVVKDVTSLNSKNFHVNVIGCEKLTFERFKIDAPGTSINTDGIHVGRSKEVTIIDTNIGTGDDCISIGDGTTDLKIEKVTCGPGHGKK